MKRFLANILLLFCELFVLIICSEIMLRYFTKDPYRSLVDDKPVLILNLDKQAEPGVNVNKTLFYRESSNPNLLYVHNPNMLLVFNRSGEGIYRKYKKGYIILFQTNQFGLRDYEYSVEKPERTFRIVMLGDSITVGNGLILDETVSKFIERMLNNDLNLKLTMNVDKFEVINFGVSGYNVTQETEMLKTKALVFSPDLVIFNYALNDVDYPHKLEIISGEGKNKGIIKKIEGNCTVTFLKIKIPCSVKESYKKYEIIGIA